jgi:hypothetical protein
MNNTKPVRWLRFLPRWSLLAAIVSVTSPLTLIGN